MIIKAKVKPNSKKNEIILEEGVYLVKIKAPAEKGKANKEIIKLFSKKFKKRARIVKGLKSREKLLSLE